ncbi:MAG: Rpn family recombination-promoting nuclease/putative transposase [Clostridia bacterium]|nr:Rpn family recombination-promoting nuclease/putative transposase [Clostridia bacterium]
MEKNEAIKKANEEYKYLIGDEAERRIAFLREKAIKDEISNVEGAREEGKELGKKEKQIEIAKKLFQMGLNKKQIKEATELSIEEIESILNK